jgi:hypothetical protein
MTKVNTSQQFQRTWSQSRSHLPKIHQYRLQALSNTITKKVTTAEKDHYQNESTLYKDPVSQINVLLRSITTGRECIPYCWIHLTRFRANSEQTIKRTKIVTLTQPCLRCSHEYSKLLIERLTALITTENESRSGDQGNQILTQAEFDHRYHVEKGQVHIKECDTRWNMIPNSKDLSKIIFKNNYNNNLHFVRGSPRLWTV